jgi:addiction module HigA family antidote
VRKRQPAHPGEILDGHYIKPLRLNLSKLADRLSISRNTLFKIRKGVASISVQIALSLAEAFETTPQFWLNLQQNYDLWVEAQEHERIRPIVKNGSLLPGERNLQIAAASAHIYR